MQEFRFKISLKCIPYGPVNNNPASVQIMARGLLGDKPLSTPMMVRLSTYIGFTLPQWVKTKFDKKHNLANKDAITNFINYLTSYC